MAEFDLEDLKDIYNNPEIIDYLVEKKIIKREKFLEQYAYESELNKLQLEFVALQNQLLEQNKRVLILFEGRDAAGKGGTIERLTQNLNPKKMNIVSLPKPTELERGQWYFQRYLTHLPNAGEIVFFDRSWYNRAVVEPVFDFCTKEQYKVFMKQVPSLEQLLIEDGIILIKIFLSISKKEQQSRLESRKKEPLKQWKLGTLDQQAQEKWDVYSEYIEKLFSKTSSKENPWIEINTDDKKLARIAAFRYIIAKLSNKKNYKIPSEIQIHTK